MFYLIQFVKSLGETLIRGFSFFFFSCLLAFTLTHRPWIAQIIEKISPEKMANPYFVAVIDSSVNSMRLTKLVNSLPGVVAIQEKSNEENETKINQLVSQLGSDYQVTSDLLQFKSIKFVLSPSLSDESLAFVRQQVIKYGGQGHVNATDIKYPEVTELMKTNLFYHMLSDYGDWLMIAVVGLFWIISFWLVYDAFRARSYIIEKFQRKTDVASKIIASGLGSIVLLFTGSGVLNGTMKFFDLIILLMIFSIFWSFSLETLEMENTKMKSLLLMLFYSYSVAFAAVPRHPGDDLARYRSEVMELGSRLTSLEKEIGSKSNLYISSVEQIKQFESDIKLYKDKLVDLHREVREAQAENKKIIHSYLTESESDSGEAWQRKVHFELLKQAQMKLKNKETELISLENKVTEFDEKLSSLKKDEEELSVVIKELEVRKKETMAIYLTKVESKRLAENKVEKNKILKKVSEIRKTFSSEPVILKKPERFFKMPVSDYVTYTPSKKGVTFKFKAIQPVKAVGSGKIVFAGDLASYGQVVLIDHGKDLRTVLLGKMDVKVKKNDIVQDGEILAYTQKNSTEDQTLYFEVRKKNTAQNTILWLDQNGVSKI